MTGTVVRFLRAYRLQSKSAQNTIVLDVDQARRADQIALDQALTVDTWMVVPLVYPFWRRTRHIDRRLFPYRR